MENAVVQQIRKRIPHFSLTSMVNSRNIVEHASFTLKVMKLSVRNYL